MFRRRTRRPSETEFSAPPSSREPTTLSTRGPIADEVRSHRERYLRLLKDALLDVHYLENEVRLEYLTSLGPAGVDAEALRDPVRTLRVRYQWLAEAREAGRSTDDLRIELPRPYADVGRAGLDHLEAAIVDVARRGVVGDVVDCGVSRGGSAILLRACMDAYAIDGRDLWVVDQFLAATADLPGGAPAGRQKLWADLNQVRDAFDRFGLLDERVRFLAGGYDQSLADAEIGPVALLRLGVDASYDLRTILGQLLPRASVGATVIIEGTGRAMIARRLENFAAKTGLRGEPERVDWNTVAWRVTSPPSAPVADVSPAPVLHRVPLAPSRKDQSVDLSVVVVFYDMAREALRTLQSLSRTYQRDIDDLTYEVIVIDNGSCAEQRLLASAVEAYGPEFRLVSIDHAVASPTAALNLGIAESRGSAVAVMIDGAHVLTPGVFHQALVAMDAYRPSIVAIQQWYVGPGQQGDAQQAGYDQQVEDQLFRSVRWPTDGYRLFDIGHFIGDRDWFDGIIESNCLFAPRWLYEQVGGFDDSFDMAGGGYANLELFERLHSHPGVNIASVLGEGTFHQFHGGTTTNVADEAVRRERVFSYGEHFRQVRGRGLQGLTKPVRYVGSMDTKASRRTRSRRAYALSFDRDRDPLADTETPSVAVPEELKVAAIEAVWDHQAWREATWLGTPVGRYPADLHSYQELIATTRPEVVVLLGDDAGLGGRALFVAGIEELIDHGRVVAVGRAGIGERPTHHRLTWVDGAAEDLSVVQQVHEHVGDDDALVLIGLGATERVTEAFNAYSPLVPVGGYVVIENTVLNGRPAAATFGPGPHEAVVALLAQHHDFVPDVSYERYTVTFNKNGYLRRTARR